MLPEPAPVKYTHRASPSDTLPQHSNRQLSATASSRALTKLRFPALLLLTQTVNSLSQLRDVHSHQASLSGTLPPHSNHQLCHNFFSNSSPAYFSDLLTVYTPSRQLRSSADERTLRIPHVRTKPFGQHCFSYVLLFLLRAPSNGIRSLLTSVIFSPPLSSKLVMVCAG